jgi:hypothetical protein
MKTTTLILIMFLINSADFKAQETDSIKNRLNTETSLYVGAFYTQLLSEDLYGIAFDLKYYPYKRFGTGIEFSATEKKILDTFSYSIEKPILEYYEFCWTNQFDFLHSNRIRMGVNLNNGIAIARLGDNAIKETFYSQYGYGEIAKKVAANFFYLIEPGLDISIRLFSFKKCPDLYFTSKAKYRFQIGDCKYGQIKDFSNYYIGIGISIIGFNQ